MLLPKKILILLLFAFVPSVFCAAQQQSVNWVDAHALPINNNDKHLAYLSGELKDNAILGLAEASHGTHEFSVEKNRIINYLVKHANYKAIGFEFGYTKMAAINNYLQTGKGDLKQLMAQLRLFNTQEIFDLFQSVKAYNDTQPAQQKVKLFGFDADFFKADNDSSAVYCINYLTKNPALFKSGQAAIPALKRVASAGLNYVADLPETDIQNIIDLYEEVKAKGNSTDDIFLLFKKHLSLLYQCTLVGDPLARDVYMAENLAEIQQRSKAKTIIWSHNIHIAKDTVMTECKGMGYYLRQKYGKQYYAVGFDTYKGNVNVLLGDDFVQHSFESAAASYSAMFAAANLPAFFMPFSNTAGSPLYNVSGSITNIYANWTARRKLNIRPGIEFDALIFIRETTASVVLK